MSKVCDCYAPASLSAPLLLSREMAGELRGSRRRHLRPVAHLAICDGTAALSGLKRGPHNVELHPLVVVFNAGLLLFGPASQTDVRSHNMCTTQ